MKEQKINNRTNDRRIIIVTIALGILLAGALVLQMYLKARTAAEESAKIMRAFDSVNASLKEPLDTSLNTTSYQDYLGTDTIVESTMPADSTIQR